MTATFRRQLILVFLIILSSCNPTGEVTSEKELVVGFIGPLSGDASAFGTPVKNAFELAIEEINQAGGIKGTSLRAIYEDGKCAEKDAVTAAHKLINVDRVKVIFAFCSAETLPIIPLTEENSVIVFTSSTNPAVSDAGESVFRVSYSDKDTAHVAAEKMAKDSKRVGVIYEQTSYPVGLKDAFRKEFEIVGGEVIEEGYGQNEQDMRTQLTKLLSKNPNAIFVDPDTPATGIAVLKQLKELQFKGKIYGNYFGSSQDVIYSPEADGIIFFADPTVEENLLKEQMFKKYNERYGENPQFEFFGATMYDAVYIMKQAIETSGNNPADIRDYLYQMDNFTGLLGKYHFDENGDARGIRPSVKQIKNNQIIAYG